MSKKLEAEPRFMKASREAEQDRVRDLALYHNHRIVLTNEQRRRARLRADKQIASRRDRVEG